MKYSYIAALACVGAATLAGAAPTLKGLNPFGTRHPSSRHSSVTALIGNGNSFDETASEQNIPITPQQTANAGTAAPAGNPPSTVRKPQPLWRKVIEKVQQTSRENNAPSPVNKSGRQTPTFVRRSLQETDTAASPLSRRSIVG